MDPLPDALSTHLYTGRDELFSTAETLLGFDTQNPPGRTVGIVDWIQSRIESASDGELDLVVDRVVVDPRKPNLLLTVPGETSHTLCFVGHLDTVPFDEADWERSPLGERMGGRLYGRGATDMKGAVAAMVYLVVGFARAGITPPVDVQVALVSDEEIGGDAGMMTLLDRNGFEPDACVVGETTSRAGRCSVSVADRGNIWLTIEATGTAAHGSRPMIGVNAIDRLTAAIDRLRAEFGREELRIDPAMDDIIAESIEFYKPEAGAEATRRLYRYPTINLGVIEGGTAINTVPASARARVDVRLTAGVETAEALRSIRGCLEGVDGVDITDLSWTSGTFEPIDSPIVTACTRAAAGVVEDRVYRRSATGGGDAKVLRNTGIPTVEFGFGTRTAHGTDEYTTTSALANNAEAYAAIPYEFLDVIESESPTQ